MVTLGTFLTPVTDRDGQPLLTWQTIGVVDLRREHLDSAGPLAPLLQPFDSSVTAESIGAQFGATQDDVAPIPPAIVDGLRSMMLQTVSAGTATALQDVPGLGGKTGTAEFGDNTHSHGWFAGIVDDIAFAALVVGGDTSAPAIAVSGDFLRPAVAG